MSVLVLVASPMTTNNATEGVVRIRNIGIAGFDLRFEEYSNTSDSYHPLETTGWIAIEPGTWTLDGKTLIAGTQSGITESFSSISFSQSFSGSPVVLSQIQSYNEIDEGSHARVNSTSTTGFEVKIEEEIDTTHINETIGYIALEPNTLRSGSAKVSETKYYPFGVIQEGGSDKYLYTGKELDKGTGLYYYEARYYNPNVGRFIQPDTLIPDVYNPQSLNRYSYVLNNPLRYVDPSGEIVITSYLIAQVLDVAINVVEAGYSVYKGVTGKQSLVETGKEIVTLIVSEAITPEVPFSDDVIRHPEIVEKLVEVAGGVAAEEMMEETIGTVVSFGIDSVEYGLTSYVESAVDLTRSVLDPRELATLGPVRTYDCDEDGCEWSENPLDPLYDSFSSEPQRTPGYYPAPISYGNPSDGSSTMGAGEGGAYSSDGGGYSGSSGRNWWGSGGSIYDHPEETGCWHGSCA